MIALDLLDPHRSAIVRATLLGPTAEYFATDQGEDILVTFTINVIDEATPIFKRIAESMAALGAAALAASNVTAELYRQVAEDAANRRHNERTVHP